MLRLALLCLATTASAETPMSPQAFETWSTGKTLDYSVNGDVYGSESYFPGRIVRDADTGGECRDGRWYPDGPAVCFVYDGFDGTHCWLYWREGDTVFAKPLTAAAGEPAQEVSESAAPLSCPGPDVGV